MPATYEPIATTTLGTAATITFSSIPATYTDIVCVINATAAASTAYTNLRFNGDTGTNYSWTLLTGDGATATSSRGTSTTFIPSLYRSTAQPTLAIIHLFSYAGSTNKTVLIENSSDLNGSGVVDRRVGLWRNTAAITQISFAATLPIGTTATLYGIKNA
jgi:hypothetical protein